MPKPDNYQEMRNRTKLEVLTDIQNNKPEIKKYVRIVGAWVWIEFSDKPDKDTRAYLKAAGFHWSKNREAWQHPCGVFRKRSNYDPREKYGVQSFTNLEDAAA